MEEAGTQGLALIVRTVPNLLDIFTSLKMLLPASVSHFPKFWGIGELVKSLLDLADALSEPWQSAVLPLPLYTTVGVSLDLHFLITQRDHKSSWCQSTVGMLHECKGTGQRVFAKSKVK